MRHQVPGEFNNETKWFRFFGNKQFVLLGIAAAITYLFYKIAMFFGVGGFPGIVMGIIVGIILVAPSMIPVPETQFLKGGGTTFDVIFVRLLIRKRTRKIYVRGWNKDTVD